MTWFFDYMTEQQPKNLLDNSLGDNYLSFFIWYQKVALIESVLCVQKLILNDNFKI